MPRLYRRSVVPSDAGPQNALSLRPRAMGDDGRRPRRNVAPVRYNFEPSLEVKREHDWPVRTPRSLLRHARGRKHAACTLQLWLPACRCAVRSLRDGSLAFLACGAATDAPPWRSRAPTVRCAAAAITAATPKSARIRQACLARRAGCGSRQAAPSNPGGSGGAAAPLLAAHLARACVCQLRFLRLDAAAPPLPTPVPPRLLR